MDGYGDGTVQAGGWMDTQNDRRIHMVEWVW